MVKIVDLPIGTKFQFPEGFGVFERTIFRVAHIPDDKSYVVAAFADPSADCLQIKPYVQVVPCYD